MPASGRGNRGPHDVLAGKSSIRDRGGGFQGWPQPDIYRNCSTVPRFAANAVLATGTPA